MDYLLLAQVVDELDEALRGGKISRISLNSRGDLVLIAAKGRERFPLLLSPARALPRIHLLSAQPALSPPTSGFALYLKSHLTGSTIRSIRILNEDRIIEIACVRMGKAYGLVFELFGPRSNIILRNSSSTILAVLRPVPPADGVQRPLLDGLEYVLPRNPQKPRSGKEPGKPPEPLFSGELTSLPVNRALEQRFAQRLNDLEKDRLRNEILRSLGAALARAERKAAAVKRDLDGAEKAEEFRRMGELLLANLSMVGKGVEAVRLTGHDGMDVVVKIDPRYSAAKNAELCFRKYKKAKAGHALLCRRRDQAAVEISRLNAFRVDLDAADSLADLLLIRDRLEQTGIPGKKLQATVASGIASVPYRTFLFEGWQILVGKNAAGNDMITRGIARPDDLWLHAEGISGSHVLVRNPGRTDIPRQVLLKAAALAAYYSKGRHARKIAVAWTQARYVRRPKGARPGLVTLLRRETVVAEPEAG